MPNALTLSAALRRRKGESLLDYLYRLETTAEGISDTRAQIQELTERLAEEEAAAAALTQLTALVDEMTVPGADVADAAAAPQPPAQPEPESANAAGDTPDPQAPPPAADEGEGTAEFPLSRRDQIRAYIRVNPWQTLVEIRDGLDFPKGTVSGAVSALKTFGDIVVHDGRYALKGTPMPETALEEASPAAEAPAPVVEAASELPAPKEEPAPAVETPSMPEAKPVIRPFRPSTREQVLELLQRKPRVEFTAQGVAEELGASVPVVEAFLKGLHRTGTVSASPEEEDGTRWFCWMPPEPAAEQPAPVPLPPIPPKLSTDEVSVFDALRREPEGLTKRVLATRLNWTGSRLDRVLNRLTQAAHVGPMGDRFRVFAQDLDAGAAD